MQLHRLYYGPMDGEGIKLYTSQGIRELVTDAIIQDRYTLQGNMYRTVFDSQIHTTTKGPVLSLTKVERVQASDGRTCYANHTIFIALSDVMGDLKRYLDFEESDNLQPLNLHVEE
jgi:hypothetical protein